MRPVPWPAAAPGIKPGIILGIALGIALTCAAPRAGAHPTDVAIDAQVRAFLERLPPPARERTHLAFDDPERFRFRWTPGARTGVTLGALDDAQRHRLRDVLASVLSDPGVRKLDAILATEAALGVIENAPGYRDPGKYHTVVFGDPGADAWALRFEGHHLSVNLTFRGAALVAATPLFLGANPETIDAGPDRGLRALAAEVDGGWALHDALSDTQRALARGSDEWFAGFLTSPGERRANLGKPAGVPASALDAPQQALLRRLVAAYVETVAPAYAAPYLDAALREEWPHLRFFWSGADTRGGDYYYRIAGRRLLIEHDNRAGATHVHAIWRDLEHDFGGP